MFSSKMVERFIDLFALSLVKTKSSYQGWYSQNFPISNFVQNSYNHFANFQQNIIQACYLLIVNNWSSYNHLTNFVKTSYGSLFKFYRLIIIIILIMNIIWTSQELVMNFLNNFSWTNYNLLTTFLWPSYDLLMTCLQSSYDLLTTLLRPSYGHLMTFVRPYYNILTTFLWPSYNLIMTFLWPSYNLITNSL